MYPDTPNLPALPSQSFYVLLALARGPAHGYAIGAIAVNDALGAIKMADGTLYPILKRLFDQGLIEIGGVRPGKKPGQKQIDYALSETGLSYLQAEIKRLQYAVAIADASGLTETTEFAVASPAPSSRQP